MPCNSDHMDANRKEIALSKVACLLDELAGNTNLNLRNWDGYHPAVYCKSRSKEDADALVSKLCSRLQTLDVTKQSLEMQMWWRDHQAADKARLKKEMEQEKTDQEKEVALSKLTDYERKLILNK